MSRLALDMQDIGSRFEDVEQPYRYALGDCCGDTHRTLVWCMLNPSTADGFRDDPTSRKVAHFTRSAHRFTGGPAFGRWLIVNAYAYRATRPHDLWLARLQGGVDIFGPRNADVIRTVSREHDHCVVAWGANIEPDHAPRMLELLQYGPLKLWTLGAERTKSGQPRHPLYLRNDTPLVPWGGVA